MQLPVPQIFVYGSLRRGFQSPAFEYITRYFEFVAEAKVKGMLFDMGEFPAAVPTEENYFLAGELYRIRHEEEFNWAMEQLDAYEGIHSDPEDNTPPYRRDLTTVFTPEGSCTAWIYWYDGIITDKPFIPSGDMLEYLHEKQKNGQHGF